MNAPQRIQLSRAKGWRMPTGTIKVDRTTRWGNPWIVGAPGQVRWHWQGATHRHPVQRDLCARDTVDAFIWWLIGYSIMADLRPTCADQNARPFWQHMAARRLTVHAHLHMLRGHDLACWCKPDAPCHADVLLAIANCPPGQITDTLQALRSD